MEKFKSEQNCGHFKYFADSLAKELASQNEISDNIQSVLHSAFEYFKQPFFPKIRIINNVACSLENGVTVIQAHGATKFLLDSVREFLIEEECKTLRILHVSARSSRNEKNELQQKNHHDLLREGKKESFIHIETQRIPDSRLTFFQNELNQILVDCSFVVSDFFPITSILNKIVGNLNNKLKFQQNSNNHDEHIAMLIKFLSWLRQGHYIFLGYQQYQENILHKKTFLQPLRTSSLGIFRNLANPEIHILDHVCQENKKQGGFLPRHFLVAKHFLKSRVGHRISMNVIQLKEMDNNSTTWHCFFGFFTKRALVKETAQIPILNSKVAHIANKKKLSKQSFLYREWINTINALPKDLLFSATMEELETLTDDIILSYRKQSFSLFYRLGLGQTVASILFAMPEKYLNTRNFDAIRNILEEEFAGICLQHHQHKSQPGFWIISFFLKLNPHSNNSRKQIDKNELESKFLFVLRTWNENLESCIRLKFGNKANDLIQRYGKSFESKYQSTHTVEIACKDITILEFFWKHNKQTQFKLVDVTEPYTNTKPYSIFKIYSAKQVYLSSVVPIFATIGLTVLDESIYSVFVNNEQIFLHEFTIQFQEQALSTKLYGPPLEELSHKIFAGHMGKGYLNRLILVENMSPEEINVIRTYYNYYLQTEIISSEKNIASILVKHSATMSGLYEWFNAKFNPTLTLAPPKRKQLVDKIKNKIQTYIQGVQSPLEDHVLTCFFQLMENTVRTNFFIPKSKSEDHFSIAIKIDVQKLDYLSKPKLFREIYVLASEMRGIHIRGGEIARGGIRFSDRTDYRNEVLALAKTQMIKNTIIVPVGSKGGFITMPIDPEKQGHDPSFLKQQYQIFISALLDITDNILDTGKVETPEHVLRYDKLDPYLVVAPDKGTSQLSDAANEISEKRDFWLGDAFASGGSKGYDHKTLAITAKGAWECVKLHFLENNKDIQSEEFTVAGVGDMSGDVFGNGMLLSRKIKLIAAFNHKHIFLDPNPDPEISFMERQRLFELPFSQWSDYNKKLISPGGGVFPRHSTRIELSPEIRKTLGITGKFTSGNQLISVILKTPVELLWFGGIGTYVKSSHESHEDVRDKVNNDARINAKELRAKVIGEGANLGLTQLARVEYALKNGKINTDSVDNSGGVHLSDLEVNLKILCRQLVREDLVDSDPKMRDQHLQKVSNNLVSTILRSNKLTSMSISMDLEKSKLNMHIFKDLANNLEKQKILNQHTEQTPTTQQFIMYEAEKKGLPRPHMAILANHEKMRLYREILQSDISNVLPSTPNYVKKHFLSYFPLNFIQKFPETSFWKHPLTKEILSTQLSNHIMQNMGSTFIYALHRNHGFSYPEIVQSYLFAEECYDIMKLRNQVFHCSMSLAQGYQSWLRIQTIFQTVVTWLLKFPDLLHDTNSSINDLQKHIHKFALIKKNTPKTLSKDTPESAINHLHATQNFFSCLALQKKHNHISFEEAYNTLHEIRYFLHLDKLTPLLIKLKTGNSWEEILKCRILWEYREITYRLASDYYRGVSFNNIKSFMHDRKTQLNNYFHWFQSIRTQEAYELEAFDLILKYLWDLTKT